MNVTPIDLQRRQSTDEAGNSDVDGYDPKLPLLKNSNENQAEVTEDQKPAENASEPTVNESASPDNSDDEYDPESMNPSPEPERAQTNDTQGDDVSDDEYDPENGLASPEPKKEPTPVPNLPSKPSVAAASNPKSPQSQLKDAYDAIMQSDLVKRPEFKQLTQEQQMSLIDQQLREKGIVLPQLDSDPAMNYDQVYSFNKPFDSRNTFSMVPQNKFCKRPNITVPMSSQESEAFTKFLEIEASLDKKALDEFPDRSKLFIGNLSTNTISKEDLFRICNSYGEVVSITLKGGYGFVQFTTAEQCAECIKGETDVPLHGRIMRLDASTGSKKGAHENVKFRERIADEDTTDTSTSERRGPDCQIFITSDSTPQLVQEATRVFENAGITLKIDDIGDQDLSNVIPDAAYSGVLAACIIKNESVDLQTFEESEEGGIKFDEYVDLAPLVAVDVVKRMKPSEPKPPVQRKRIHEDRYADQGNHDRGRNDRLSNRNYYQDYQSKKQRKKDRHNEKQYQPNIPSIPYQNPLPYPSNNQSPYGLPTAPTHLQAQPAYPGYPSGPFQNTSHVFPQGQTQPALTDPNVIQLLQNVDPNTLQQVIALLQQQQAPAIPQPNMMFQQPMHGGYSGGYSQPAPPPPPPIVQQPSQLNSLLSQLQAPQAPQTLQQPYLNQGALLQQQPTNFQQHPQQHRQHQQPATLMDMLARLSKQ